MNSFVKFEDLYPGMVLYKSIGESNVIYMVWGVSNNSALIQSKLGRLSRLMILGSDEINRGKFVNKKAAEFRKLKNKQHLRRKGKDYQVVLKMPSFVVLRDMRTGEIKIHQFHQISSLKLEVI